jgi:hypothetical protein
MALPMMMEIGLERGFRTALSDFVLMQLQLASVFFTFSLGTKTHYYGRTLLHGGAEYRATGRGCVVLCCVPCQICQQLPTVFVRPLQLINLDDWFSVGYSS